MNYTFSKVVEIKKEEVSNLQNLLNMGEDVTKRGLVQPGEVVFLHISKFDNGYTMNIELSTPDFEVDGEDYFGLSLDIYLYNKNGEEVDRCVSEHTKIDDKFTLYDEFNSKYEVKILSI